MLPPICILAGGLGSRLGEITKTTPKPLLEVAGKPFLEHQIHLLAHYGAGNIVLCVGHLGEQVERTIGYLQDGITISYSYDSKELDGTLGAIRRARHLLGSRFLVLYGDTYLQINYADVANAWEESGRLAVMTVLRNNNNWDSSNAIFRDNTVLQYDKFAPTPAMHWIDYGLGGLTTEAIDLVDNQVSDLAYLYRVLAQQDQLFGYEATERFYEIGSPESWIETDAKLRSLGEQN